MDIHTNQKKESLLLKKIICVHTTNIEFHKEAVLYQHDLNTTYSLCGLRHSYVSFLIQLLNNKPCSILNLIFTPFK